TTTFAQVFDSRNAGPRLLKASGVVVDGNSGNNYAYTFTDTAGNIDPRPITVTAAPDTKDYDGTTSSNKTPTFPGLQSGDTTTTFTQVFDSRNAGPRMLISSGTVVDGNGGNNYSYNFVSTAGNIDKSPITVNATSDSKTYDGNT